MQQVAVAFRSLFALLSVGLVGWPLVAYTGDMQRVIDTFYGQTTKEQVASFSGYPLEEQYAIYIYGNQVRHPPAIYLAAPFARAGDKVVPFLLGRLKSAKDDPTVRDLVLVFSEMNRQTTYDVAGDAELMRQLESSIAAMKNQGWRGIAEGELAEIRKSNARS
jgi:hypothetical protein